MSIYNQYADKPWMRPPMYTSDAGPPRVAGVARTTEMVNGEVVVVDGREHYQPTEFGDGRPDPNMVDRSPMVYRGPDTASVIDLDDHDELDTAPPQYVPQHHYVQHIEPVVSPADPKPQPHPQLMNNPYPGEDPRRHPKLIVDMHGVSARPGFTATATVSIGNTFLCEADAEDLKLAANFFTAWAKMLSTIRN